jgi:acetyl-CoA acetyltransferase family protein
MSLVPMGASAMVPAVGLPFGPAMMRRYAPEGGLVPQGISAELIAGRWGLTRDDLDAYAVRSHARAEAAAEHGRFAAEILPVPGKRRDRETGTIIEAKKPVRRDEGIRKGTTVEALGKLKAAFRAGGQVTAGNSSQFSDGAAALLLMSEARAAELGYTPRARFHAFALAGVDPISMLTAPIPATTRVLERAKLAVDDVDVVEINEAFASVVLAWERELHPDMDKVNVKGGAIALGHPLGATGARLTTTLLYELERTGGRFGLQTMCEGGGMANATIIERLG